MKKRIGLVILALCMLAMCSVFASCSKASAYDVVSEAAKKTQNLDSVAMDVEAEVSMKADGASFSMPITAEVAAKGVNSDKPEIYIKQSASMFGMSMNVETYQKDGWIYVDDGDTQYKTDDEETKAEYGMVETVKSVAKELPKDLLKDVEVMENADKNKIVKASIPKDKFFDIYGDFAKDMISEYADEDADVSDINVSITIADGYILSYSLEFAMEATEEGVDTEMTVSFTVTYKNPGEEVTVTPMDGYEDYEELQYVDEDYEWDEDNTDWGDENDFDLSGDAIIME